jgi:MoxR-like ATPase
LADETSVRLQALRAAVAGVIHGKDEVIDQLLVAILAGGHVLLEDVPGVGKSTLARAAASAMGCTFRRIQFTSDLLPGDILGVNVYDAGAAEFRFKPGPIFAHLVLADEINRTTPKTQSALLEAMSNAEVHLDGVGHALPQPFHVIATQNPFEQHGAYPLPESQMDRFLVRLTMGYPDREAERRVMYRTGEGGGDLDPVMDPEQLAELQQRAARVTVAASLEDYVLEIVEATRRSPRLSLGASPRGTQALIRAARARALLDGRDYAVPDDVKQFAVPVLAHRVLAADALPGEGLPVADVVAEIVAGVRPPA